MPKQQTNKPRSLTVRKSSNYDLFEKNEDNREVRLGKHRKLKESIKKHGLLPYWPIVVTSGPSPKKILDGQHRFFIAKELGLPIYYMVCPIDFDIAELNNTQKVWNTEDYALLYASKGVKDYQEALDFKNEYRIPITTTFALLAGHTNYSNIEPSFKSGKFRVRDREWAEKVVGTYCPIVAMTSAVKSARFLEACMAACRLEEFNPSRMIQGAEGCKEKLTSYSTRDGFLQMMEDIYNYRRRTLFPLKIEAMNAMKERNAINKKKAKSNLKKGETKSKGKKVA